MPKRLISKICYDKSDIGAGFESIWTVIDKTLETLLIIREFCDLFPKKNKIKIYQEQSEENKRLSLKEKRRKKFYDDYELLHSELKIIMKNEAVKELLFITGASPLNPRETWKLNINQTDYENITKPKLLCVSQLLADDFFDSKRPSGNLHILIGLHESNKSNSYSCFEPLSSFIGSEKGNLLEIDFGTKPEYSIEEMAENNLNLSEHYLRSTVFLKRIS